MLLAWAAKHAGGDPDYAPADPGFLRGLRQRQISWLIANASSDDSLIWPAVVVNTSGGA